MSKPPPSYDDEAARYDETRGGTARAEAAAEAVAELVASPGTAIDVAGGTGIVSEALQARGWSVLVADQSPGMLAVAAGRVPGRVVCCPAQRLPIRDASVDLVTIIWLLHLLPVGVADQVIAESARVLRRGGHLVTTVDKDLAHGRGRRTGGDHGERVASVARDLGLQFEGQTSFSATTQWDTADSADLQVFPVMALRRS